MSQQRPKRRRLSPQEAESERAAAAREATRRRARATVEAEFGLGGAIASTKLTFGADGLPIGPVDARVRGVLCFPLPPAEREALCRAHATIRAKVLAEGEPMGWAGGSDPRDPRWRGFGLPPGARGALGGLCFRSFEVRWTNRAVKEAGVDTGSRQCSM